MKLPPATLKGNYFSTQKERFIPIGAHWVPAVAALDWTQQWDEASIEADFAKMKDLGFNTVRFDLFWAWFEPRPGDYNPEAFAPAGCLDPPGTPVRDLPAPSPVHRRGGGRSLLGRALAAGTPPACRPRDAAPADRSRR